MRFIDCSQMEDQLAALGERWSHVCQWAEQRFTSLTRLVEHWKQLDSDLSRLKSWLADHEQSLRLIEANPSADRNQMVDVARQLQVSHTDRIGLLPTLMSSEPALTAYVLACLIHSVSYLSET